MANDGTVKIGTELDDSGFKSGLSKLGSVATTALKGGAAVIGGIGTAATGAVSGLLALESATEEYRIAQGKLNTAFEAAGYGPEVAAQAYDRFYGILGDIDTATEASQLLAKLAKSEEDVATWADIAAGVSGTFGDALPIESLIESANETAKVGQVTGTLADALNWAGISEDEFNTKLAEAGSEAERNQLIMDTLSGTYEGATEAFYRNNEALVASREAQAQMDASLAQLGQTVSDVKARMTAEFLPSISQITSGLAGMLAGTEGADEQFAEGMNALINTAVELLPQFLDFGVQILSSLLNGLLQALPTLVEALPTVITSIVTALQALFPTIIAVGSELLTMLTDGILQYIPEMLVRIPDIITNFYNFLAENGPGIIEKGFAFLRNLVDGIVGAIPEMVAKLPEIIRAWANFVAQNLPTIVSNGIDLLKSLISGIIKAIPDLIAALPQIISAIVDGIGALMGSIIDIGKEIVEGIWEGIKGAKDWVVGKVKGFFGDVLDGAKSFLGIKSPSRLFRDQVGKNIGLGVAKGIDATKNDAVKSANDLAKSVYDTSKEWLDKQVKYQNYGLREQLEVWNEIQSQFIRESQQWADAENEILDIRSKIMQENIDLEEEYQSALESRAKEIYNIYDLFDEIGEKEKVSGDDLLKNLQDQVDSINDFYHKIGELAERDGVGKALVKEIRAMGPDAINELDALLSLSDEKLAEYAALYEEKQSLANRIAAGELSGMRQQTNEEIVRNLNALQGVYGDFVPLVGTDETETEIEMETDGSGAVESGEFLAESMAAGIENERQTVIDAAVSVAQDAVAAARAVMAEFIPSAAASVAAANSAMSPVAASTPTFAMENAIQSAAGMIAMSQSTMSQPIVLEMDGREVAKGVIGDIRSLQSQKPTIKFN